MLSGEAAAKRVQELGTQYQRIVELENRFNTLNRALLTANDLTENVHILITLESQRDTVERELLSLQKERHEKLGSILRTPFPVQIGWSSSITEPNDLANIEQGVALFASLTNHPAIEGKSVQFEKAYRDADGDMRSSYHGRSLIRIEADVEVSSVVHELGHWLEDMDSRLLEMALAFLKQRREGDSLAPLRVITGNPNYKTNEMAWKDRFLDPYMGKYYQGRHTEILSMGVEYLCKYQYLRQKIGVS
ncbi:MAG: hypothetical protein NT023_13385 [Armatimonadetes bacterium]|nr:hypothetical protein [Armatimonadota bacterium]